MADGVFNNYFFEKNMQGDITAIFKENGVKIGYYSYDAWGNVKATVSSGITALEKNIVQSYNPFRYRGYYYDTESGLYYLQSRYYNPQWGRFLNADGYLNDGLLGYNQFAYCENNPIMYVDYDGNDAAVAEIFAETMWWLALADGVLPIGDLIYATGCVFALGTIAYVAYNNTNVLEYPIPNISIYKSETKPIVISSATDIAVEDQISPCNAPIFYGADIYGKVWKITTGPMTFDEAIIWVEKVATANIYGKNASWGVYTYKETDAFALAAVLGGLLKPEFDYGDVGQYSHFHVNGRNYGKYKHFHVWYGELH